MKRRLTDEEIVARRRFLAEERQREAAKRISDESKRQTEHAEKTARLRDLRLAREAALREAGAKLKRDRGDVD
jgi:hypothetical protein